AHFDVSTAGLAGLLTGEERGGGTGVITCAIAVGLGFVVLEAGDDGEVIAEVFEGFEGGGEFVIAAGFLGEPLAGLDAVGQEEEGDARRGGAGRGGRSGECGGGQHGIKGGQREGRAQATKHGTAGKEGTFAHDSPRYFKTRNSD